MVRRKGTRENVEIPNKIKKTTSEVVLPAVVSSDEPVKSQVMRHKLWKISNITAIRNPPPPPIFIIIIIIIIFFLPWNDLCPLPSTVLIDRITQSTLTISLALPLPLMLILLNH